jgi:hypothetical protein
MTCLIYSRYLSVTRCTVRLLLDKINSLCVMFYYYYCAVTEAAFVFLALNDAAVLQFIHTAVAVSC